MKLCHEEVEVYRLILVESKGEYRNRGQSGSGLRYCIIKAPTSLDKYPGFRGFLRNPGYKTLTQLELLHVGRDGPLLPQLYSTISAVIAAN